MKRDILITSPKQNIIDAAKSLLLNKLNIKVESNPKIFLDNNSIQKAKVQFNINDNKLNTERLSICLLLTAIWRFK